MFVTSKAFNSIHKGGEMEQTLAYGLPKETVMVIMMLCRNRKVKVCSPGGDTDFSNIVAGVCQGDAISTLSIYNLSRHCISNISRSNKRKWLYAKKNDKKRTISHRNEHGLCKWYGASCKYTGPSWIPAA